MVVLFHVIVKKKKKNIYIYIYNFVIFEKNY
jgi:hypothetical protein